MQQQNGKLPSTSPKATLCLCCEHTSSRGAGSASWESTTRCACGPILGPNLVSRGNSASSEASASAYLKVEVQCGHPWYIATFGARRHTQHQYFRTCSARQAASSTAATNGSSRSASTVPRLAARGSRSRSFISALSTNTRVTGAYRSP